MNEKAANQLTEGVIWKQILIFTLPLLLSNLCQQLYTSVDTAIIGHFDSSEAMAAIGSTGSLINLIVGIFIGITIGAGVVVSQYFGARDNERVSEAIHTGVVFCLIAGVLVMLFGIFSSRSLLGMMSSPEDVIDLSTQYMQIYFAGSIFSLLYNLGSRALVALGDANRPLYYLFAASIVNVVLDLLLVAVFKTGVAGAAIATIFSQFVSAVLVLRRLSAHPATKLSIKKLRLDPPMMLRIIKVGVPTGLQSVIFSVSNTVLQSSINALGSTIMAASAAGSTVNGFVYMPMNAFVLALITFSGQNVGAREYKRAQAGLRFTLFAACGVTIFVGGMVSLFAPTFASIFDKNELVIAEAARVIRLVSSTYVLLAISDVFGGFMRGAGDSFIPMLINLVGIVGVRLLWVWTIIPGRESIVSIFLSYPISWTISAIAMIIYYLTGRWKHAKLI